MIGAMIRLRPTAWKDALRRLPRADLGAIKRAFPGYPYTDLLRAIEVSVDGLDSADRERYHDSWRCFLKINRYPKKHYARSGIWTRRTPATA
jgi:hypothetical protein